MSPLLISKAAARYTGAGGKEHCSLCRHFSPRRGGRCARVLGDISPRGWCRLFSREMRAMIADATSFNGGGGGLSLSLDFMVPGTLDPRITFTRASTATYFDSAGVMQTAAVNTPRWDYDPVTLALRGLLIEEARTNGTRNSTMVGAVPGSPGTAPTNWVMVTVANVVITIIGTGTENGVPYIDISLVGTPTANSAIQINTDGTTAIAATNGQTWTSSFYCSLLSGSWTNAPLATSIAMRAAGGGALSDLVSGPFVPTTGRMQRFSFTTTTNNASTAFVLPKSVYILTTASQPINVTLRLGAPQLEQGAFATSYIPTTSASVLRAVDICNITPLGSWFNASAGTLLMDFDMSKSGAAIGGFSSGAFANTHYYAPNAAQAIIASAGTSITQGGIVLGTPSKVAMAYSVGRLALSVNGQAPVTNATLPAGPYPWTSNLAIGAQPWSTGNNMCGHARTYKYWNTALTNAELQALSTL